MSVSKDRWSCVMCRLIYVPMSKGESIGIMTTDGQLLACTVGTNSTTILIGI
jgi:hypothetical protein